MLDYKLEKIYKFLLENRKYNKITQEGFYKSTLMPYDNSNDMVLSLLYDVANSQSQPKIDKLASFFQSLADTPNCLDSFNNFLDKVSNNSDRTYRNLYRGMCNQSGWGTKTAALFTKSIFHIHNNQYQVKKIWNDVPSNIDTSDDFYLPVDAVMINIFKYISPENQSWNYKKISNKIKEIYEREEIEVWDDLWFWGFITQKGGGKRIFEWNINKYWMIKFAPKSSKMIDEVKLKAKEFLIILNE